MTLRCNMYDFTASPFLQLILSWETMTAGLELDPGFTGILTLPKLVCFTGAGSSYGSKADDVN